MSQDLFSSLDWINGWCDFPFKLKDREKKVPSRCITKNRDEIDNQIKKKITAMTGFFFFVFSFFFFVLVADTVVVLFFLEFYPLCHHTFYPFSSTTSPYLSSHPTKLVVLWIFSRSSVEIKFNICHFGLMSSLYISPSYKILLQAFNFSKFDRVEEKRDIEEESVKCTWSSWILKPIYVCRRRKKNSIRKGVKTERK